MSIYLIAIDDLQVGSLHSVLHQGTGLVVDSARAVQFAIDVAKGMAFIHSLDRQLPRLYLNSHHVMVSMKLLVVTTLTPTRHVCYRSTACPTTSWWRGSTWQTPSSASRRRARCITRPG